MKPSRFLREIARRIAGPSSVLALAAIVSSACVDTPTNGSAVAYHPGEQVFFYGFATAPNASIRIQIIRDPLLSGTSNTDWVDLPPAVRSSTAASTFHADKPLYQFDATVTPIPAASTPEERKRWPEGGVTRFRLLQEGTPMTVFDDQSCHREHATRMSSMDVALLCQSHQVDKIWIADSDGWEGRARPSFLSARATAPAESGEYYAALGAERTLAEWLRNRGFTGAESVARYYNAGDLGLGRAMRCTTRADGMRACAVTNYGNPADGLSDEASALSALASGTGALATIAMDYRPGIAANGVRFYVYKHLPGGGTELAPSVELDSQGAKPVPGLCLSCHGGSYNPTTNEVRGAQFLPFDLQAFRFSTVIARGPQEETFRRLNNLVKGTLPTAGIAELIQGWYGGAVHIPSAPFDPTFVPDAWREPCDSALVEGRPAQACRAGYVCSSSTGPGVCRDDARVTPRGEPANVALYRKVFAPYCRSCHLAQTPGSLGLDFARPGPFRDLAADATCAGRMPHAEVIYQEFWKSGARAHLLGASGKFKGCGRAP